jgi:DNA polymerase-3 subunit gamma/tau
LPDLFGAEPEPEPPPAGPGLFGAASPPPDGGPGLFGGVAEPAPEGPARVTAYRVLARKYRPENFDSLIGQEGLKRVLTRAFDQGRIAHAWMLTGVRGVGKTTTARILARALNCLGVDGTQDKPTINPCGVCANCRAILDDRHPDIIEMDAASKTGVDDVREIIEGARYRPVAARYKVTIVDEVHMLSKSAFNALLKTLEEPPPHQKFVFATTEIRKVPVTVLSRCQRFDLRRVPQETLAAHYSAIAAKEGIAVEESAIAMIARAADGSVRDGLSLLDQAIAAAEDAAPVTADSVRAMLGLADRIAVFDLFADVMQGRLSDALAKFAAQHDAGADPLTVIEDLLALTHMVTLFRVEPREADKPGLPEAERTRGQELAKALPVPALARAWQMLLKGFSEVKDASDRRAATEMVLIRLAHAADLPSPADLVRALGTGAPAAKPTPSQAPSGGGPSASMMRAVAGGAPVVAAAPAPLPTNLPRDLGAIHALALARNEPLLASQIANAVHLLRLEPGLLEFRPAAGAPRDLAGRLGALLGDATGLRWTVAIGTGAGQDTLNQQGATQDQALRARIRAHPTMAAILATFPGAAIELVRADAAVAPPPDGAATDGPDFGAPGFGAPEGDPFSTELFDDIPIDDSDPEDAP